MYRVVWTGGKGIESADFDDISKARNFADSLASSGYDTILYEGGAIE